jgi:hypothetical protein
VRDISPLAFMPLYDTKGIIQNKPDNSFFAEESVANAGKKAVN